MESVRKKKRNIYKDFSIRKFVGQVNLDLTGMGHEATKPLHVHSPAIFPGLELFAGDPESVISPGVVVEDLIDPAIAVTFDLPLAWISVPHLRAVLPGQIVVALPGDLVVPVAEVPGVEFVAGDPVLIIGPVVLVDPAATVALKLPVAWISVPHLRAVLPVPLVIAVLVFPVVIAVAGVPGVEFVAGDPERFPGIVVLVDPAAVTFALPLACVSPPHLRAVLPVPPFAVVLDGPGHVVVEGDRDGIFEVVHQVIDLYSVCQRGNKSECEFHRRRFFIFYLLLNSDLLGLLYSVISGSRYFFGL